MPTLTISLPEELKDKLDAKVPKWKEALVKRLEKRANQLLRFEEIVERGEI